MCDDPRRTFHNDNFTYPFLLYTYVRSRFLTETDLLIVCFGIQASLKSPGIRYQSEDCEQGVKIFSIISQCEEDKQNSLILPLLSFLN